MDSDLLNCPVCFDEFDYDVENFSTDEQKRSSRLPTLSAKCSHKICASCLNDMQMVAIADKSAKAKDPKWHKCHSCKEKTTFNAVDIKIDLYACKTIAQMNKRRKTTGDDDVDLTPMQLMERLLQCDAEKIVADAEENEDATALKNLASTSSKLKAFSETSYSSALQAFHEWDDRKRKCVECQEAVGPGYEICAGTIGKWDLPTFRSCPGNAMCSKCYEEKKESGDLKICSDCENFICEDCIFTQQCGYSRETDEYYMRDEWGDECGSYVCSGCFNGNGFHRARLCLQCEMFACQMCAWELISFHEVCETCGNGGNRLCNRAECVEEQIECEHRCTCHKKR